MTKRLYLYFIALRLWCASDSGFIHPDEWFQNGEIVAGDLFNIDVQRTWEFNSSYPIRSILPLYATNSLLAVMKATGITDASASTIFMAQRLSFFSMSFLLDFCFYQLLPSSLNLAQKLAALCMWACSGFIFTFQLRTFSNSTEALVLAGCLLCLKRLAESRKSKVLSIRRGFVIGFLLALGLFTRVTFVAFVLPTVLAFAYLYWQHVYSESGSRQARSFILSLLPIPLAFSIMSAVLIYFDTVYYTSFPSSTTTPTSWSEFFSSIKLTPLNLLRYNLSTSNLNLHGIHPRWLHFVVNLPMVVSFSAFIVCLVEVGRHFESRKEKENYASRIERDNEFMQRVFLATVFVGTAIMSIIPHQEPRFLVPVALPAMLVWCTALPKFSANISYPLMMSFLVQSLIMTIVLSKTHQAGLLPALFQLNADLYAITAPCELDPLSWRTPEWFDPGKSKVVMVFWKTFPPPRHLLLLPPPDPHAVSDSECEAREPFDLGAEVVDVMGASTERVYSLLSTLSSRKEATVLLISPSYAVHRLEEGTDFAALLPPPLYRFWPHVNMDDLMEDFRIDLRRMFQMEVRVVMDPHQRCPVTESRTCPADSGLNPS